MFMDTLVLSLYFETPLHTGASGVLGAIDLPIQRERTTQWPVIHAAELRQALRSSLGEEGKIFGAEAEVDNAVSVGDARLLLFPVRSSIAPFIWITCPAVLARLRRDLERTVGGPFPACPTVNGEEVLVTAEWSHGSDPFAVEDVVLAPKPGFDGAGLLRLLPSAGSYDGLAHQVDASLGVVSDEVFGFLVRTAIEICPVEGGNGSATYQELMPSDSLFCAPLLAAAPAGKGKKKESPLQVIDKQLASHLQVGGGSPLGRGWARTSLLRTKGVTP